MEFRVWNEWEGRKVRPSKVSTGIIGSIPGLEIRCNLKRSQLDNKNKVAEIINKLREEGII